ncbi:hypothetical protein A9Q83_04105 [Alphaproteobacteria bacterium 46_93_T64]|nr:hypothetical protein A9Q83_04105 [Alphaproteobacteria bacterium 46_93_T64]
MRSQLKISKAQYLLIAGGVLVSNLLGSQAIAAPTIIELVQVPCQFLGIEQDHGFTSQKKADCEAINEKTAAERLEKSKVMMLKPGEYIFRVSNKNVPYELGFWLREKDYNWANPVHKLTKTSISGGGMHMGKTIEYEVTLKPGEYLFSCPLNTTPDYNLIVSDS